MHGMRISCMVSAVFLGNINSNGVFAWSFLRVMTASGPVDLCSNTISWACHRLMHAWHVHFLPGTLLMHDDALLMQDDCLDYQKFYFSIVIFHEFD
jgi:hypothetical protein